MSKTKCWQTQHYPHLFGMWQDWISQSHWQPVDLWLKHWQRRNPYSPRETSNRGNYRKPRSPAHTRKTGSAINQDQLREERLLLSEALFVAMRYLQLASALECAFQTSLNNPDATKTIDWQKWDEHWTPQTAYKIGADKLWYWFGLRIQYNCPPPPSLADAHRRQQWLMEEQKHFSDSSNLDIWLIWHGLRPQWASYLVERKELSNWDDRDRLKFVREQNSFPPLWLRAQKGAQDAELATKLREEGVLIATASGLSASGGKGIQETTAYKSGLVEIQDLASQQIAMAVNAQPGDKVWDTCAGAGGKSLAIASRMGNKGVIVATDLHEYKLTELKRRAKRADISTIRTFPWDGQAPLRLPKEIARQQGFDWVLIDAPCSASGTWRRNPDARWRFFPQECEPLIQLQAQLLSQAEPAVREGGHLVYATCSWLAEENEHQVDCFLQRHPGFHLIYQKLLGLPAEDSDTMFVAVLRKHIDGPPTA